MEYIRGRTLDQVAREGRLKPRRAAALLAKVAGAADYAHRQGDLPPGHQAEEHPGR